MNTIEEQIQALRTKVIGEVNDIVTMDEFEYEVPTINNDNMQFLEDITFYETVVDGESYCDSKQFLFQDVYKHVFILSKRGIGKTFSVHDYVLRSALEFIKLELPDSLRFNRRNEVQLPINVAYILQNALYHGSLIKTFNEILSDMEIGKGVDMRVVSYQGDRIAIEVRIDFGAQRAFTKLYYFAECFFLTQPNLARGRQFKDISFVVFDEFEKAFAKSLLDEDRNRIDSDTLFDNFKDILNSFQRNKRLRYLYMGNITNLNSIIWDFLEIVDFDFEIQINEHEAGDKILILNLIPLFTNESMANYFEDLTTLGISEEDLFKTRGFISEDNVIDELDVNSFIIFDDNYIYYFKDKICNVERVSMESMEKLNKAIDQEFITIKHIKVDDDTLMDEWLKKHNMENNIWTQALVPLQDLQNETQIEEIKKMKVYSTGKILLDGTVTVNKESDFFKQFRKNSYKFRNLREYFIYANLIGK